MEALVLDVALGALESLEMRSLTWGFVDQSLSEAEAQDVIEAAFTAGSLKDDAANALDALCGASLVRMLTVDGGRRYRTRFAEIVRLLFRLRQWFDGQPWQAAPTLVSDFRVDVRTRHYPDRNIAPTDAWARINEQHRLSSFQRRVWDALVDGDARFDLSQFQLDSSRRLLGAERGSGTIITAGTGSGKTLAFYLPALVGIAPEIRSGEWWTKAVCLYPRQELLKDQLSEAYGLVLRAADVLKTQGRRPMVLGSFFGPTPYEASEAAVRRAGWSEVPAGFICPFLRCPSCKSQMLWPWESLRRQRELLRCADSACLTQADSTTLRLTRRSVQVQPPDLLFSTTEMINARLSDTHSRHVFGVKQPDARVPLYALLDEVHTYAGVSGAQVALLLRRWAALLNVKVRWAGLSATLPQPTRFFAELTGVRPDEVACVAPAPGDMISEGAEYNIVLRSDAASQVATLSTSIQAIMLLARMLDPPGCGVSEGRFGSRAFVFTDDLDVTNRLFDNLLDAEAYNRWRKADTTRQPLAALRGFVRPEQGDREREGQCWQMAEELQTSLANRLLVGRTSSRDPGVDACANVIVATSTLEVGFNDPNVGAVFQHKAPRSAASFLQRRGRAGRNRRMRPLTVTVLSDYGRDRIAFQSYEDLFSPTVEIQSLPIKNLYILRMQAVYATFDWIAAQAPTNVRGWSWRVFSGPITSNTPRAFLEHAKDTLRSLVRLESQAVQALRAHLRSALGIDAATLESVLWDQPRALFLEALPTLARRLFRDWELASADGLDFHVATPPHPLPDFVPANLFSDLNLPEVQIRIPGAGGANEVAALPIVQALQQFAPGRARRRFADWQGRVSHWMPLDLLQPVQDLSIASYAVRNEYLGRCGDVSVFRPWELQLTAIPQSLAESSNAQWDWRCHFEVRGDPTRVVLPGVAGLGLMESLEFRLHRFGAALSVWRFAVGGEAQPRVHRQERRISFRLVDQHKAPAAVGFVFEADALLVPFTLPGPAELAQLNLSPEMARWLRYLGLSHYVGCDPTLRPKLNVFLRDWLQQIVLLAGVAIAEREAVALDEALRRLLAAPDQAEFEPAIDALVAATRQPWPKDDDDDDDSQPAPGATSSRLANAIATALADRSIIEALIGLVTRWIAPSAADWGEWLSQLTRWTVGEAIYQACVSSAPHNAATEGLTIDLDQAGEELRAIVAETTLGGGGAIEALAETFASDPRAFVRGLESACSPTDREMAAGALRRVVLLLPVAPELRQSLANLRAAADTQAHESARTEFFGLLASHGVPMSRTLSMLIATRLVRPGATPQSDRLTFLLLNAWQSLEEKHGISFPCRLAAALIGLTVRIPELTAFAGAGREIVTAGMLLWPWGGELRQHALQSYSPYRAATMVDAALARVLLFDSRLPIVVFDSPDWEAQAVRALATRGIVRLVTRETNQSWRTHIARLLGAPIVSGFLQFYPMIEATRILSDGRLAIDLLLRDRV